MALNPRIMAIPPQPTDREEHIHRFLTSLPKANPDLGSNDLQTDQPDDRSSKENKIEMDDKKSGKLEGKSGQNGDTIDHARTGGRRGSRT